MTATKGIQCSVHGFIAGTYEECPVCMRMREEARFLDRHVIPTPAVVERVRASPFTPSGEPKPVVTPAPIPRASAEPAATPAPLPPRGCCGCIGAWLWWAVVCYLILVMTVGCLRIVMEASRDPVRLDPARNPTVTPRPPGPRAFPEGPAGECVAPPPPGRGPQGPPGELGAGCRVVAPNIVRCVGPEQKAQATAPLPAPLTLPSHQHCVILPNADVAYGSFRVTSGRYTMEYREEENHFLVSGPYSTSRLGAGSERGSSPVGIKRKANGEWFVGPELVRIDAMTNKLSNALCLGAGNYYLEKVEIPTPKDAAATLPAPPHVSAECIVLPLADVAYGRFVLVTGLNTAVYQADNNLVVYDNKDGVVSATGTVAPTLEGMRRTADGDWYIGTRKAWKLPTLSHYSQLCLTLSGTLERRPPPDLRDEL